MAYKNPIHEALYRAVVRPEMNKRKQSIEGSVQQVNYYEQTARIYWRDPDSGAERESANVPMPLTGDGVFNKTMEAGDRVTLNFRNGNHASPYIAMVWKKTNGVDYSSKNGAGIPKGIGFL